MKVNTNIKVLNKDVNVRDTYSAAIEDYGKKRNRENSSLAEYSDGNGASRTESCTILTYRTEVRTQLPFIAQPSCRRGVL